MEKEVENLGNNHNSFGMGFLAGAIFSLLAIFFLATKAGRQLAKKINFEDFDLGKLDEILSKEAGKITKDESKNINNGKDQASQPMTVLRQETTSNPPKQSILGRRFFHRKR